MCFVPFKLLSRLYGFFLGNFPRKKAGKEVEVVGFSFAFPSYINQNEIISQTNYSKR